MTPNQIILIAVAMLFSLWASMALGAWVYSWGRNNKLPVPTFPKKEVETPNRPVPFVQVKP